MRYTLFVFSLALILAAACSQKPGCFLQDQATILAADAVGSALECENKAAIQSDLGEQIAKIGLCKQDTPTGLIGDMVCPSLTAAVLLAVEKKIPASWGCKSVVAKEKLTELMLGVCKKIPVSVSK
jgi:hypothetical protein